MTKLSKKQREKLLEAGRLLREAEKPVRVLRTVGWPPEVAAKFFTDGAKELPRHDYVPVDDSPVQEKLAAARKLIDGDSPAHLWLTRAAQSLETGARMLSAVGTKAFHDHSASLYKTPAAPMLDGESRPLDLALQLDETLEAFRPTDGQPLGTPEPSEVMGADELAARMRPVIERFFGEEAPEVTVVDSLSANALAGPRAIRLRRGAAFTPHDLQQLIQHEAFIHVATSLNGKAQEDLPLLAGGHPGTTRTQEGLAVFSEMITGAMDPARLRRLADRVIAIQMSIEGADFLELYQFFRERGNGEGQAFESARRVVRGGLVTGGAPFTKDVVYLEGLLQVHNFLRATVQFGRLDCLHLLFAGKLDVQDLPALIMLAENGLCRFPRFLPPWVVDSGFLISYLAYSSFLNRVNLTKVRQHYHDMLAHIPKLDIPVRESDPFVHVTVASTNGMDLD
ncbi:flavohemoglobin expression-modulating QEGLA motif protein [Aestuariispira insulae]|uniref:Uncharacterized protein (TIGR02421 family) n=1 Tax=Aestuariispira insulae TaxID=1461337 RepID=A0A3D9HX10_9PROT|nr:flavohemoglobin expression-modulating QEGLA motif protein [Aestuariispira insulae]RED54027.1 uncharacterized protein (TIGR02421 family) [Aestuariispira insulae]